MMNTYLLKAPGNNPTPRRVARIDTRHGITRLALDTDTVTDAVRWYTSDELKAVNAPADVEALIRAHENLEALKYILRSGIDYRDERDSYEWRLQYQIDVALGKKALVVEMPDDMMVNIRQAMYCNIAVVASTKAAA